MLLFFSMHACEKIKKFRCPPNTKHSVKTQFTKQVTLRFVACLKNFLGLIFCQFFLCLVHSSIHSNVCTTGKEHVKWGHKHVHNLQECGNIRSSSHLSGPPPSAGFFLGGLLEIEGPPAQTGMKAIQVKHEKFNCKSLGGAQLGLMSNSRQK